MIILSTYGRPVLLCPRLRIWTLYTFWRSILAVVRDNISRRSWKKSFPLVNLSSKRRRIPNNMLKNIKKIRLSNWIPSFCTYFRPIWSKRSYIITRITKWSTLYPKMREFQVKSSSGCSIYSALVKQNSEKYYNSFLCPKEKTKNIKRMKGKSKTISPNTSKKMTSIDAASSSISPYTKNCPFPLFLNSNYYLKQSKLTTTEWLSWSNGKK